MKISRYKKELDYSYALGATLTWELLKYRPESVIRIYVSPSLKESAATERLFACCGELGIGVVSGEKAFNILSPKENCFVIGEFKKTEQRIGEGRHIVLVNPSDAGNLGTIVRTAAGFGLKNIAVVRPAVDFYDPRTIRASMGAAFHVNVEYFDSIEDYRARFPQNRLYAFMLTASVSIHDTEIREPFSLVFGNEAAGLPDEYAEFCSSVIIPHSKGIDSLNLPIAASIGMYEFTKNDFRL